MTTFNSKRFAKLAGILKEASPEELRSAAAAEDRNLADDERQSEERHDFFGIIKQYNTENPGNELNADVLIQNRIDTPEKLNDHIGKLKLIPESKKSNKKVLSSSPVSISLKAAMKSCDHLNECGCQMEKAPFDAPEDEPQGYMLVQNLKKLAAKAAELSTMANHDDDAEPWVESKINSAAHHIDAIYDYIKYGRPSEDHMMHEPKSMPHDDFSDLDVHMANTYEENE